MRLDNTTKGLMAAIVLMGGGSTVLASNGSADFTLDGEQVNVAAMDIETGVTKALKYNGGSASCTRVAWYLRKEGESDWGEAFDKTRTATLEKLFRAGSHELKMTATGYNGKWFYGLLGCDHTGQYDERVVNINIDTPGYAQTKHPIMLVPGVMAFDDILGMEYFYRVADKIRETSDQRIADVSLSPWQNTEDRGADLANKILDFLILHDEHFGTPESTMKVNLIAHSHGSTTSRVAINILANEFGENAKVASLTTVAGPHYGTPTADGAHWAVENWGNTGKGLGHFLLDSLIGNVAGTAAAILSGHANEYGDQEVMQVLSDFTQKGMARFNTCYPSVGVPGGGKYFIEEPLDGITPLIDLPIENGRITINDCQNFRDTTLQATSDIILADTPDSAYGAGTQDLGTHVYGNGLGVEAKADDADAIRYYSFTGIGEWNTQFGADNQLELADPALLVINSMFALPGERTTEGYFWTWVNDTGSNLLSGTAVARDKGYTKDSDAFIPVDSTRFGEFLGTFGPWNHVDEQNGLLGWVDPEADDPLAIYEDHANRLQQAGL